MSLVIKVVNPALVVFGRNSHPSTPLSSFSYIYKPYQLFKAYEIPGPPPRTFFGCYKELAAFSEASYQCSRCYPLLVNTKCSISYVLLIATVFICEVVIGPASSSVNHYKQHIHTASDMSIYFFNAKWLLVGVSSEKYV